MRGVKGEGVERVKREGWKREGRKGRRGYERGAGRRGE